MTANDKSKTETGRTPGIRDLQKDEIDTVSGGATGKTTTCGRSRYRPGSGP